MLQILGLYITHALFEEDNIIHFRLLDDETLEFVWYYVCNCISSNFKFFCFLLKLSVICTLLDRFNVLISKIIFLKKNIINMYFDMKSYLKSNHY
jgi:hypothetical protein